MPNTSSTDGSPAWEIIPGCLSVVHSWLSWPDAAALFQNLMAEIAWEQKTISFYGKKSDLPRLVAWYGDAGANYRYSGVVHKAKPWTPALAALKPRLDALLPKESVPFNGVLLNYYRDQHDKIGYHADDEQDLGTTPFIASLSLGATRRFLLKPKAKPGKNKVEIPLRNGTLVCMYGSCQQKWLHGVPTERTITGPRINLTLRQMTL